MINRFINERRFLVLLGTHDFAESLITAEWLYDSMKKAKAIDLTIIGMGYFKAVEQLLYELICFHKNQGLCIRNIPLDDDHIALYLSGEKSSETLDLTLGAMAMFVSLINILKKSSLLKGQPNKRGKNKRK